MSMEHMLFGKGHFLSKAANIMGLGVPNLLYGILNPEQKAMKPTPGEYSTQTAKEGEPRPIVYGIARPIAGNIIDTTEAIVKTEYVKVKSQGGKGGKKKSQKQAVEKVYRTYAIRVCEGPITGFRRIWRNNKLVYDGRAGSEWGARNNHVFLSLARLYTGDWNQMPDPTLESLHGIGNVPAYRGTAYIVFVNEDLTDLGGAIPQWQFEVARSEGFILTSKLYNLEHYADVQFDNITSITEGFNNTFKESVAFGDLNITSGILKTNINTYEFTESLAFGDLNITSGILKTNINTSEFSESVAFGDLNITSGVLKFKIVSHDTNPAESVEFGDLNITGGVLKE